MQYRGFVLAPERRFASRASNLRRVHHCGVRDLHFQKFEKGQWPVKNRNLDRPRTLFRRQLLRDLGSVNKGLVESTNEFWRLQVLAFLNLPLVYRWQVPPLLKVRSHQCFMSQRKPERRAIKFGGGSQVGYGLM